MKWLVIGVCAAVLPAPVMAETATAKGAVLRMLDKLSGHTEDVVLGSGETVQRGPLTIRMDECRYPANDPSSDAFAHITVADTRAQALAFDGWMIASSPALSAMDHPRYDVWVLNCDVPGLDQPAPAEPENDAEE